MPNEVPTRSLSHIVTEAEAQVEKRQFQKALELLNEGRGVSGTPAEEGSLLYTTGLSLLGLSRPLEAANAFRKAADLFETAGDAEKRGQSLEQAAGSHYARRNFGDAVTLFRQAVAVYKAGKHPAGVARALRSIGNVQVDTGDRNGARASFDEARRIYQETGDAEGVALSVMSTASLTYETQGTAGAVAEYRKCIEDDQCEHHLALNNLGFLLTLDKQFDEARQYLDRAEKDLARRGVNDEDGGLLNLNLGNLDLLQGRLADAERHLQAAIGHFHNEGKTRAIEVVVLANDKVKGEGFEPFTLTDDGIKEAVALCATAALRVAQGKLDEALQAARAAVEMDGQMAYPYTALGWVHVARNESDEATAAFRKASGKEPNNAQIRQALDRVNPFANARVGRNDACPCGSGKKFKKCHGAG